MNVLNKYSSLKLKIKKLKYIDHMESWVGLGQSNVRVRI
jgi:hypothetical protein